MSHKLLGVDAYRDRLVYRWQFNMIEVVAKKRPDGKFSVEVSQRNQVIAKTDDSNPMPCIGAAIKWAEMRLEDRASDWYPVVKLISKRCHVEASSSAG